MKWVCQVCGYIHEGDQPPEFCPKCKAPAEKFTKQEGDKVWACEQVLGVASSAPERFLKSTGTFRRNVENHFMKQQFCPKPS